MATVSMDAPVGCDGSLDEDLEFEHIMEQPRMQNDAAEAADHVGTAAICHGKAHCKYQVITPVPSCSVMVRK